MFCKQFSYAVMFGVLPAMMFTSGCAHKYENPITKDTQQPDKVLFDTSIDDIEHGRYERARLTLQTMMNTYDTSEYLAKAKLAMADSWKREGGAHGMAQAEADYKDFILFYPSMEEAAEAQFKICDMQYLQLDKSDRDAMHARMAEAECKDVLEKWPNSKFAPDAANKLREVQEVEADGEFKVAMQYYKRGGKDYSPAANRFQGLADQYPLYSQLDEALWLGADAYNQMGDRFEDRQAAMYTQLVRDFPLSPHFEDAKRQLVAMNRPVPEVDQVQLSRQKFELANRPKRGFMDKVVGPFSSRPSTLNAAKSGAPPMEGFKPTIPQNVPLAAQNVPTTNTVSISQTAGQDIIGKAPDARTGAAETPAATTPPASTPPPVDKLSNPDAKPETAAATPAAGTDPTAAVDPKSKKKVSLKPVKPPKQQALKKKARPADQKGTAAPPAQTPQTTPAATQTAPPAQTTTPTTGKTPGGGGGNVPEARPQ